MQENIFDRLRLIRENKKLSQVEMAYKLDISVNGYINYEKGKRIIPSDLLQKLTQMWGVNANWLFTGQGEIFSDTNVCSYSSTYKLPVRGNVEASMGYGITVYDETQTATYEISKKLAHDLSITPTKSEVILAKGDSMEPTIFGGDSLIVDLSKKDIIDGVIYCIRLDGQLLVKRLQRLSRDTVGIVSDNQKYKLREVSLNTNIDDFSIIGEVKWWGRIAK